MYNPSLHTATNKPIGLTNKPVDARTYYYDTATLSYRPYASTSEVLGYLVGVQRVGQFSIIIASGGINTEWWFKDGISDSDLRLKVSSGIITQAIPTNSDGHYDYTYDGSLGATPTAFLQIAITSPSAGWSTLGFADLLDNGHIYARADFSTDTYRLLIKP